MADNNEPTVIAKIQFPEFDPNDIETWFMCLEAAFNVNGLRNDKFKFNAVIVALGSRARYVHSVIAKCNEASSSDRYEQIKSAVIAHFRPSETQRLTSLLSGMSLGDQKPSTLLSEMRRLGGNGCSDSVLSNLWLRALPNTVRSIIAAMPTATLDEQANVADKILEAPRGEIAAVQTLRQSTETLEQRIDALSQRLEAVMTNNVRHRDRSQSRQRWTGQRSRNPSRERTSRRWICWFHYRHGNQARKCEKQKGDNPNVPCIFFDGNIEVYTNPKKT